MEFVIVHTDPYEADIEDMDGRYLGRAFCKRGGLWFAEDADGDSLGIQFASVKEAAGLLARDARRFGGYATD